MESHVRAPCKGNCRVDGLRVTYSTAPGFCEGSSIKNDIFRFYAIRARVNTHKHTQQPQEGNVGAVVGHPCKLLRAVFTFAFL